MDWKCATFCSREITRASIVATPVAVATSNTVGMAAEEAEVEISSDEEDAADESFGLEMSENVRL